MLADHRTCNAWSSPHELLATSLVAQFSSFLTSPGGNSYMAGLTVKFEK